MTSPLFLGLPLLAGLVYAIAAILAKRALECGLGPWRMTVINSWIYALVFLPLFFFDGVPLRELVWYQPVVLSLVLLLGNVLMFLAFSRGDVSVAAPIMGTKVILVALFTVLVLGQAVPVAWWIGAGLATLGIGLLRSPDATPIRGHLSRTILYAVCSAACFAFSDVLVQRWIPLAQFTRFLPVLFLLAAVWSLVLTGFFRASVRAIPQQVWGYLVPGGVLMALQSMLFVLALSKFGRATAINILYNTRGLWSVLVVWRAGHWFGSQEAHAGHRVMADRLAGALFLVAAIVLVLV